MIAGTGRTITPSMETTLTATITSRASACLQSRTLRGTSQFVNMRQYLGHGPVEIMGDERVQFYLDQGARQGLVLDDRDAVLARKRLDGLRHISLPLATIFGAEVSFFRYSSATAMW